MYAKRAPFLRCLSKAGTERDADSTRSEPRSAHPATGRQRAQTGRQNKTNLSGQRGPVSTFPDDTWPLGHGSGHKRQLCRETAEAAKKWKKRVTGKAGGDGSEQAGWRNAESELPSRSYAWTPLNAHCTLGADYVYNAAARAPDEFAAPSLSRLKEEEKLGF